MYKNPYFKSLLFSIMLLICLYLAACSDDNDDMIYDVCPINFSFEIVDEEGLNLIAPDECLNGKDFSLEFNGKVYDCIWDWDPITMGYGDYGRAYMPTFRALYYDTFSKKLCFGLLDGQNNWNISLKFVLPNGDKHNLTFVYNWTKGNIKSKLQLDGTTVNDERHNNYHCTIIIKKLFKNKC